MQDVQQEITTSEFIMTVFARISFSREFFHDFFHEFFRELFVTFARVGDPKVWSGALREEKKILSSRRDFTIPIKQPQRWLAGEERKSPTCTHLFNPKNPIKIKSIVGTPRPIVLRLCSFLFAASSIFFFLAESFFPSPQRAKKKRRKREKRKIFTGGSVCKCIRGKRSRDVAK